MTAFSEQALRRRELEALAAYDLTDRNEADVRADFLDPLLRLLGYGLGTRHAVRRERQLRLAPPVRKIGSHLLKLDYEPTVFGERLWIIEAKRPQDDDLFADEHLGQAWSYATDPRVAVPLMVLCDGQRLAVFDLTTSEWDSPVFDAAQAELPPKFDELFSWIGAPRVAEKVRLRQLEHLRHALAAQVDLAALDKTVSDVEAIVRDVRPQVVQRRQQLRDEARARIETAGAAAVAKVGMWGIAQEINGPDGVRWMDIDRVVAGIRDVSPLIRRREFDAIENSTKPRHQTHTRMWFGLRVVRLAAAVLLSDVDGCADHCARAAREAAALHATAFAGDPLLAAGYRLQKALGQLGWRMAPHLQPDLDAQAAKLKAALEPEEWLRRDGEMGVTARDAYKRVALLTPRMLLAAVDPWDADTVQKHAAEAELTLSRLPKLEAFENEQPAGDPWLASWATTDPLREWSESVLRTIASRPDSEPAALARDLLGHYDAS